jgi:hypothetical protein
MNLQTNKKGLQSGTPQANARIGSHAISHSDYSTKIRVGDKVVGKVIGDEFVKSVRSKRHFLEKPPAIAFDVESLDQARALGATRVKIIDLDTGTVYRVTIELIYSKGFHFNRGHGDQIGLTLNYWQLEGSTLNTQPALWR